VAVNGLRSRNRISAGQILRLPTRVVLAPEPVVLASAAPEPPAGPAPAVAPPESSAAGESPSAGGTPSAGETRVAAETRTAAETPAEASPAATPAPAPEVAVVAQAELPRAKPEAPEIESAPAESSAHAEIADSAAPEPEVVPAYYEVRRGDTISRIAARFGLSERELAARNGLRNRHRIAAGQRLRVAPAAAPPEGAEAVATSETPAEARPEAEAPRPEAEAPLQPAQPAPGPPPAAVADARAEVGVPELPDEPAVAVGAEEALIAAGEVPGAEDARLAEAVVTEAPQVVATAVGPRGGPPDPSDYSVTPDHRITVHADETIGHYAEWLGVSASRLRQINGMRPRTPLVIGRQRKLDFSRVTPEVFEERRLEYHRTLQEEFFEAYEVTGITSHVLRRGETLWQLSRQRYEIPMWLLVQYNPDLDFGSLSPGTTLVIPVVEARADQG
jgi:membrane-bound lytic murein transglycosylase D